MSETAPSDGPVLPRWALYLMLPGIAMPLLIFVFILLTESAHDPDDCPYLPSGERVLEGGVRVVEERRRCLSEVEERRFSLVRGGQQRQILGRRRFAPAAFDDGRYEWSASISEQGEVQVVVRNQGHGEVLFREGTPEEREKGISY